MGTTDLSERLRRLAPTEAAARVESLLSRTYEYRGWEDVYRDEWTWDDVVKVTHTRVNCISACSLDAYVKDGIVWREEQNANYPQAFDDVPDFNPRGCPSGCAYSIQMYDPTRVRYPLKRVGERGEGRWERLSWDQAFSEIADRIIDTIVEDGAECIVFDHGTTNIDNGIGTPVESHLFGGALGGSSLDSWAGVGDLPVGLIQTWGTYMSEGTSDDWFLSDYILIWIGNPNYTHPSDAHFMWEARYRGAKVVSIAPDFNASTVHADRWLNVRMGTDAALALGLAHVIVEEGLHDVPFVKEQTDLPFLVRDDDDRFLRRSDVDPDGPDGSGERFYVWDAATETLALAPGTWGAPLMTLELDGLDPALEGAHEVTLADGSTVTVRPVFERLRARLADYPPERVAEITGVHAENVRTVARELAAARSAMIYASWGACKHYHSDLFQRGMAYLVALTGNTGGKSGSGIKVSTWWPMPGFVIMGEGAELRTTPPEELPVDRLQMMQASKMMFEMSPMLRSTPLIPWLYAHDPEWREAATRYADPVLPRPVADYMDEVIEKGWQPIWPRPPKKPRFFYYSGPNPLRRWPNPKTIRDSLWKSIETIVACDFRMSTSAMWSDYVLPACGYYEKPGIKYTQSYLPYVVVGQRAVPELYESRHEWDIVLGLARAIQERATARGVDVFHDSNGLPHDLSRLHDDITGGGYYDEGPGGEVRALDYILENSPVTKATDLGGDPWKTAATEGMVKIESIDPVQLAVGLNSVMSDFDPSRPINQFAWFVNDKNPWPTLTGRQQFYIDHPWFLDVGEELVCHKEPLAAGGDHPLRLTGGHTRWSQHAIFRANETLLRLQRGEPVAYVSVADAAARGVDDHDRIRLFNDVGEFTVRAKVSPSVQPGEVICYHAWESYQFPGGATQNDVAPSPLKPNNMIGGYGHLQYRVAYMSMNHIPKEVAVDFERAPG